MKNLLSRRALVLVAAVLAAVPLLALALLPVPYVSAFAKLMLAGLCLLLVLWGGWRAYKAFLWKVGRRLAFSYFLIGVLPIPMALLLLGLGAYILSGFFLGHLYRDAVEEVQRDLDARTRLEAQELAHTGKVPQAGGADVAFGYYRDGRRVGGDARTPAAWPAGIEAVGSATAAASKAEAGGISAGEPKLHFFLGPGGEPTLASAVKSGRVGVVALYAGALDEEVSRRAGLWVEIERPGNLDLDVVNLEVWDRRIPLQRLGATGRETDPEAQKFMKRLSRGDRFWDSPRLSWVELSGPLYDPASGKMRAEYVPAALTGTPRTITRHLFTGSSVDTATWGALLILGLLLLNVYGVATLMAVLMIFGLSRAVNRLSRATEAVRSGDFSVRIPVRRKDQLGDLQRSFNQMSGDLESLVAASTQKELLEKELALARDLQKSLLPSDLPSDGGISIATLFAPSAAIGGDYFDVIRLGDGTLAVFIADVSGHGLSAGLRMAMIKAALTVLVAETRDPEEILRRLDGVVRSTGERRSFVTATLALLDLASGRLEIINAGHPPTYLLRAGEVREILLPGSALGGLGKTYGRTILQVEKGDFLVWLSDGLIEATNEAAESFGYDRVAQTLSGAAEHVEELRDRLVNAVDLHAGGRPPSDDRTLLVLGYGHDMKQERLATA